MSNQDRAVDNMMEADDAQARAEHSVRFWIPHIALAVGVVVLLIAYSGNDPQRVHHAASSGGGAMLLILGAIYFLPAIIAPKRGHHNTMAIAAINVFLGWIIGWVAALVWALTIPR